jgi:hypothetical protein
LSLLALITGLKVEFGYLEQTNRNCQDQINHALDSPATGAKKYLDENVTGKNIVLLSIIILKTSRRNNGQVETEKDGSE